MSVLDYIAPVISGLFLFTAAFWSLMRLKAARMTVRLAHATSLIGMGLAVWALIKGAAWLTIVAGLVLLAGSLLAVLIDKTPGRWLALIQILTGIALAAGFLIAPA